MLTWKQKLVIILNSTVLFLIAYILIFSLTSLFTGISASVFDIPTRVYYNQILFFIASNDWTSDAVKAIFSTGPILSLIMGILLWILYSKVNEETGILKLLVAWMMAHCIVFFFGDIMMGALFTKGFGYVIMYLYFMDTGKMILTLFAFTAMFTLGLFMARGLLYTANTYVTVLRGDKAGQFTLFQYLIPYVIGNIIIYLVKLPDISLYEIFLNASLILFLVPIIIRSDMLQDLYFEEEPKKIKVYWISLCIVLVMLPLFRIIFGIGIRF
ncbi:hypothetical protein ACFLS7_00085 [Bacteroidota bacterium]